MALARSQRGRIVETERLNLKSSAPAVQVAPTPPQRSPLRNSPTNARASPVALRPPTPEADRSSVIYIGYIDDYANAEPSLQSTDVRINENPNQKDESEFDPESRRTSTSSVNFFELPQFSVQPDDSPYNTLELNKKLQRYSIRRSQDLSEARRSREFSGLIPEAKYSTVDQSEADRIRSLPTVDEPRGPTTPKKEAKDTISSETVSSQATAIPVTSTPARRVEIPTGESARIAPLASEPPQKHQPGLDISIPLRLESIGTAINEMFAPPASQQPSSGKTTSVTAIPPRSFIPGGSRLPIQPSSPPSALTLSNTKPPSSSPPQQSYLYGSPPVTSALPGSPPTFYSMQQHSSPNASHLQAHSPPLQSVPNPSNLYTPPSKPSYMTMPRVDHNQVVPVQQPQTVVSSTSLPRVGHPPTQPRLAQLQVGQRLSPEEHRQFLSSPETLVASSDYDSSTPYSNAQKKQAAMDAKWPSRDPTLIKMQRRNAGIVGPSSYVPPDYLTKVQEEDITEQKPLARKPPVGTGPRPESRGSDVDVKTKDETQSRGRSRVRGEDGTARLRSSHRESTPPKLARGVTVTSGMTDFSVRTKGTGHVRLGDERKLKRQELVRKRRRDVFMLKAAVLVSVLNLLLVDALLVVWLVKGGAGSIFGKA